MATTEQPPERILIVGAGLAGLALGQGLKRASPSIPFHIFERDSTATFRAQGYRIRISPEGAESLQRVLPSHLWNAFEATCAPVVQDGGHWLDALTGEARVWGGPPQKRAGGKSYNADRVVLRNLLMSGLEDQISFGKRFEGYSVGNAGEVEVRFADGSMERSTVLVGADGVRSGVRRLLNPNYTVLDTEGRAVFGKTTITPDLLSRIPDEFEKGITLTGDGMESRMKLFCDIMKFSLGNNSGFDLPADYIYWVLVFNQDLLADDNAKESLLSLDSIYSAQKACELTNHWHPTVRAIIENQEQDAASTLAFLASASAYSGTNWEELRANTKRPASVALMGDSAHPMPPVGGVGANVAFQEAADLCAALASVFLEKTDQTEKIMEYEQQMIDRANETLSAVAGAPKGFFGMKPPAELKPAKLW